MDKSPGSVKKETTVIVSISEACVSATSVLSCLPGFHLPFICLLEHPPVRFPFADEPISSLIKSAGIHRRGSLIFWQEDGDRALPRSN